MSFKYYNEDSSGVEILDAKVAVPSADDRTYDGSTQFQCKQCNCDLPGRLFASDGDANYCVYCAENELSPTLKNGLTETTAELRAAPIDPDIADMFSKAMSKAIDEGKGWKSEADRQAYLDKIGDDDFLPAIFCSNEEELSKAPDAGAFTELLYSGETPTSLMLSFKSKGNESIKLGRQNEAKNIQYYRDAVNHYLESVGWCDKVVCVDDEGYEEPKEGDENANDNDDSARSFTRSDLNVVKSTLLSNKAMAHMELKNWGYVIEDCKASVALNPQNVKSWYRLAKARQKRSEWELCAEACESGLKADSENAPLKKLNAAVEKQATKQRNARQKKERERVKRVGEVKSLWKWCKEKKFKLGRVPLVATLDDEEIEDDTEEKRWNHVQPHFGKMPVIENLMEYTFPVMFLYPTVGQSDFVEGMAGQEMVAMRLAEMFPEEGNDIPWDHSQMFKCSNLAIYFEVHQIGGVVHPESVRVLEDMKDCMRFFENARALKGADGLEAAEKARAEEREKLKVYRDQWKKAKGRWQAPADQCDVVQVHPAATLEKVLLDKRFIAPNFLVNFIIFPQDHESHKQFLKERRVVAIVQAE